MFGLTYGFFWFETVNLGWCTVYIEGAQVIFQSGDGISFSVDLFFPLENCVETDDVMHNRRGVQWEGGYITNSQIGTGR